MDFVQKSVMHALALTPMSQIGNIGCDRARISGAFGAPDILINAAGLNTVRRQMMSRIKGGTRHWRLICQRRSFLLRNLSLRCRNVRGGGL